jgi:hypothetical protein
VAQGVGPEFKAQYRKKKKKGKKKSLEIQKPLETRVSDMLLDLI